MTIPFANEYMLCVDLDMPKCSSSQLLIALLRDIKVLYSGDNNLYKIVYIIYTYLCIFYVCTHLGCILVGEIMHTYKFRIHT